METVFNEIPPFVIGMFKIDGKMCWKYSDGTVLPIMAGADGEGEGEGGEGGTGGGEGTEAGSDKDKGDGDKGKKSGKSEKDDKDDFPWDDYNRLKRERAEADRKKREEEAKRAKEQGKYEELAEREKARADAAEAKLAKMERDQMVERVAKRVGLEFPEDAPKYLSEEEMEDERSAERGLKKLKEKRPKLFVEVRKSGGSIDPPSNEDNTESRETGEVMGLARLRQVRRKS